MKKDDSKKLIGFLRDSEIRAAALKTPDIASALQKVDNASDYDVFAALCKNLYSFAGHSIRNEFLSLISPFLTEGEAYEELRLYENARLVWKRIFCEEESLRRMKPVPKIEETVNFDFKNLDKIFYLDSAIDKSFDGVFELSDAILKKIKEQSAEALYIDITEISFVRPNDYNASKAYNELKKGCGGGDALKLWLLCRTLMRANLKLLLKTDSVKKAEEVAKLIYRLRLSPQITVCADIFSDIDYDELYSFIIRYKEKSVSASLCASAKTPVDNESSVVERLSHIFSRLPILFIESIDVESDILKLALKRKLSENEVELAINYLYRAK